MSADELDAALALMRRMLKPGGRLVLGDILKPDVGAPTDVLALLSFGASHGFFQDAVIGLARTALSDYWQLRQRIGLQRYGEAEMIGKLAAAGLIATRAPENVGHNPARMTFVARVP
jgi:ubiquinone/menaquinone biosynthesis C-methylase UbiE